MGRSKNLMRARERQEETAQLKLHEAKDEGDPKLT